MRVMWETLRRFWQISDNDIENCKRGAKQNGLHYFMVKNRRGHEEYYCVTYVEVHLSAEVMRETERLFNE